MRRDLDNARRFGVELISKWKLFYMKALSIYKGKKMGRAEKNSPRKHHGSAMTSAYLVKLP